MSYYWAWHKPTTIFETGQVIRRLKTLYTNKEVLIVETGYIWTQENYDNANNIITEVHQDYAPASPENQKKWLIDLTQEVIDHGGMGVIYWEPSWVSTHCWNQWDQGSHQEHATFFDFEHNLLIPGGIQWMTHPYQGLTSATNNRNFAEFSIRYLPGNKQLTISSEDRTAPPHQVEVFNTIGQSFLTDSILSLPFEMDLGSLQQGIYVIQISTRNKIISTEKIIVE